MSKLEDTLKELEVFEANQDLQTTSLVVKEFGFFPYSVWRLSSNVLLERLCDDDIPQNTYVAKAYRDPLKRTAQKKKQYFSYKAGLSKFNTAVAQRLIEFYTKEGETILTPFGSRGIISIIAAHLKRKGVVCEVVKNYADKIVERVNNINNSQKNRLFKKHYDVTCYNTNANNMHMIPDNSIDHIITSPPFFNLEKYESCEGQLADIQDYDDFLAEYQKCLNECYRVMKPNGFCIFVVNDFRCPRKANAPTEFICFSRDTQTALLNAGFRMWDTIINFLYSTPSVISVRQRVREQVMVKAHEYILVFRK